MWHGRKKFFQLPKWLANLLQINPVASVERERKRKVLASRGETLNEVEQRFAELLARGFPPEGCADAIGADHPAELGRRWAKKAKIQKAVTIYMATAERPPARPCQYCHTLGCYGECQANVAGTRITLDYRDEDGE